MEQYRGHSATTAMVQSASAIRAEETSARYAEVWGDTVDLRHLGGSVALGIGISVGAFFAGKHVLSAFVADAAIARAYAMLVGLAGCLMAGAICAYLFKPKRLVVEHTTDESERMRVLQLLAAESGGLGSIDDLSPSARAEMEELGLLELFASAEKRRGDDAAIHGERQ
ncbi:hypothetical protein [Pandoraea communis]|uniref:Transmembrane protein n=1 Tax=Pandoraea communis TaxID=2508297 RepID=A0A5E4RD79_9BURK|nr:hypothetical protein C266_10099 [Pandoraea sp. SD6-2]VVD59988.1 hypothetical protein PCO31110_00048 [Pandoraea communis]